MIYDCFQFFNELDFLKIRLNVLNDIVDYFVLTESTITFSGDPKPLYYNENKDLFKEFNHKIIHVIVTDTPNLPDTSPFARDAHQKEARLRGLVKCKENDIIIYNDLDELPNPIKIKEILTRFDENKVYSFAQRMFYYYLNLEEVSGRLLSYAGDYKNIKEKKWLGSYMFSYKLFKSKDVLDIRCAKRETDSERISDGGWHFSYVDGDKNKTLEERISHKIKSAAHQEYNNNKVLSKINKNILNKKDIFGRPSKFRKVNVDSSYPEYIVKNLKEFNHLIYEEEKKNNKSFFWMK